MARQVLENGVILPAEYSDDWYDDMTSNLTKLDDVIGSDSEKLSSSDVGAAALSNNYNDLDNLPTIPTVNDATLTIQKNGVDVETFTANASSNVTCNITVPTKTSDLTNDSNFVDTSNSAVASGITSAKVTDYDTHIADTDIHVTTADKNKWNNQTYVFRYSSTALTASSTNSNTLLDNTDNLKVGDKVIDSSGVLFSITAIDTQNSTFTIGTALVDLAQDSDVVHKSGNETVGGVKTFDSNTLIYNSDTNATTPNLYLRSSKIEISSQGNTSGDQNLTYLDKNNTTYAYVKGAIQSNGSVVKIRAIAKDSSDNSVINELQILTYTNGNKAIFPSYSNEVDLGISNYKWKSIFATNYYYGNDNVEFSTKFVTTDTDQSITATKIFDGVNINLKSNNAEYAVTSGYKDIFFLDKNSTRLAYFRQGVYSSGLSYQTFNILGYDSNNQQVSQSITFSSGNLGLSTAFLRPNTDNVISLGDSTHKWKDVQTRAVNSLEPSSLSLPDIANKIDISSYITDLTGAPNQYISPSNGYINLRSTNADILGIVENTSGMGTISRGNNQTIAVYLPVVANSSISLYVKCISLAQAYFIPCQGNV